MKRSILLTLLLSLCLVITNVRIAFAYYDEVHYALTYYIARQAGYTPEQALRIASACVSVDYDPHMEPVQAEDWFGTPLKVLFAWNLVQEPRWKFHAFRNEKKFKEVIGNHLNAPKADKAVQEQRQLLFDQAIAAKNPGVFLHFFQDQVPHAGFGSAYGHWPVIWEGDTRKALDEGQQIGGSTDWLSFHSEDSNMELVRDTYQILTKYMQLVSWKQAEAVAKQRKFDPTDFLDVLQKLRGMNVAPAPLKDDTPLYVLKKAKWGGRGALNYYASVEELSPQEIANIEKHLRGPDLKPAVDVINAAMESARMLDNPLTTEHYRYNFDGDGNLKSKRKYLFFKYKPQLDKWVLIGTLKVTVVREVNGKEKPMKTGRVVVRAAKTREDDKEYVLGKPGSLAAGQPVVFEKMPVGELIVEVEDEAGKLLAREDYVQLIKQVRNLKIVLKQPLAKEEVGAGVYGLDGFEYTVTARGGGISGAKLHSMTPTPNADTAKATGKAPPSQTSFEFGMTGETGDWFPSWGNTRISGQLTISGLPQTVQPSESFSLNMSVSGTGEWTGTGGSTGRTIPAWFTLNGKTELTQTITVTAPKDDGEWKLQEIGAAGGAGSYSDFASGVWITVVPVYKPVEGGPVS